jgi:hypothetical protein
MQLSYTALEICRQRLGIKKLLGFEETGKASAEEITEEAAERIYEELLREAWIVPEGEAFRVTPLGQHIMHMLGEPEQFLILENPARRLTTRIYLRNGYYLCVLHERRGEESGAAEQLLIKLLPGFDQVVGAFAYTLAPGGDTEELHITGGALDEKGTITSAVDIRGSRRGESLCCESAEGADGIRIAAEDAEMEVSALVNRLTAWLLDRVAETLARKEDENGTHDR